MCVCVCAFAVTADRYESYRLYLLRCWNRKLSAAPSPIHLVEKLLSKVATITTFGEINNGSVEANTPNDNVYVVHALKLSLYGKRLPHNSNRHNKIQTKLIAL